MHRLREVLKGCIGERPHDRRDVVIVLASAGITRIADTGAHWRVVELGVSVCVC